MRAIRDYLSYVGIEIIARSVERDNLWGNQSIRNELYVV